MPRPKIFATKVLLGLTQRALDRMAANLRDGETRLDLIREAIERELDRREKRRGASR
jgi:predicted transcriptional regulator